MPSSRRSRLPLVDPTTVRLSDNFLLSDLMGCHSIYVKGYRNLFDDPDGSKLAEGRALAENVLEPLLQTSPLTITYGYISLELARKIVTYQSPEKPSYHQWNDGAACDVIIHAADNTGTPPALAAEWIDRRFPMSRTISYSESPGLCLATRLSEIEEGKPRRALYENRYVGAGKKPQYINYSANPKARDRQLADMRHHYRNQLPDEWRGAGYPTYHGGGIRQLHHVRVGRNCMYSDFMYSEAAMREGHKNVLLPTDDHIAHVCIVGSIYDAALEKLGVNRLSIVRAYEDGSWANNKFNNWRDNWQLWVIPPVGVSANEVADVFSSLRYEFEEIKSVGAGSEGVATVGGVFYD